MNRIITFICLLFFLLIASLSAVYSQLPTDKYIYGLGTLEKAVWHPNSKMIYTSGARGLIFCWDLSKSRIIDTIGDGNEYFRSICINNEGTLIAASTDNGIKVFSTETRKLIKIIGEKKHCGHIEFSPDSKLIAGSVDDRFYIWDYENSKQLVNRGYSILRSKDFCFSPDNSFIAISKGGDIILLNPLTGFTIKEFKDLVICCIEEINISKDGKKIFFETEGTFKLFNLTDESLITIDSCRGFCPIDPVTSSINPEATVACRESNSGKLALININTKEYIRSKYLTRPIDNLILSPDSKKILCLATNSDIVILDTSKLDIIANFSGHNPQCYNSDFMNENNSIVANFSDASVRLIDYVQGTYIRKIINYFFNDIIAYAISYDHKKIASECSFYSEFLGLTISDFETGKVLLRTDDITNDEYRTKFMFDKTGNYLISTLGQRLKVLNPTNGDVITDFNKQKVREGILAYCPEFNRMAVANYETIYIINTLNWTFVDSCKAMYNDLRNVILSKNADKLVAMSNTSITVFDIGSKKVIYTISESTETLISCALSPDDSILCTGNEHGSIKFWDFISSKELGFIKSQNDKIWGLTFNKEGTRLASSSLDGTIVIWKIKQSQIAESVKESEKDFQFLFISPNPANDFIEITSQNDHTLKGADERVRIFNVYGEEINLTNQHSTTPPFGHPFELEGEALRIDVSGLPPGVYFVRVGEKVGKFVKI